jgi:hypothetical protein
LTRPARLLTIGVAVIGGYAALICWFAWADIYGSHFFDHGGLVALYNVLRIVFAAALAWLVYAPGAVILAMAAGFEAVRSLRPGERYALGFFTGAGFWHLLLFGVGFAGGYTRPVAIALTLAVLVLSLPHLAACLDEIRRKLPSIWRRNGVWLPAIFAGIATLFVCVKVLCPSGGNDYFDHYFYYYIDVIRNGSLMPNEVWYHFFYSKGWGLYFLAILLTDPLAPSLVTAIFVFAGTLTVALVLERTAPRTELPWIGAILYLGLLIFTPNPPDLVGAAGWAELAKGHELSASLFLGVFWTTTRFVESPGDGRLWLTAAIAATTALVLVTTEMAIVAGAFFVVLAVWSSLTRCWRVSGAMLICATVAGIVLIVVAVINYALTGIPLDQLLLYLWPIVDLQKVARWGLLNEVLWTHFGINGYAREAVPIGWGDLRQLYHDLRLDLLWPIVMFGAIGGGFALAAGRWRGRFGSPAARALLTSEIAFIVSFVPIVAVLGAGSMQAMSVYRFSSFAFGPSLCAVLLLCAAFPYPSWAKALAAGTVIAAVVLSGETGKHGREMLTGIPMLSGKAVSFATGRMSIAEAYRHPGWPGRYRWGGIYPAMEEVWKIVGRGTPVYSFNLQSYCMLPDCRVLRWDDTRTVPEFETVLLGTADQAVASIKRAGINYFFYSIELADLPNGISTPIILSPIFAPDAIAQYFAVKWSDGTSYLLTWRGQGGQPLDEAFLTAYRRQFEAASIRVSFPLAEWRSVFDHFKTYGLHPYRLPWCLVCPGVPMD